MADLVVGMARSVVEGAVTKAQAAIEEEAKLRQSAQRNLVFITGEFQMMQSFLNVADNERLKNPVVRTWVRQIRDLAYDVEDCIEFVVHLDKKNRWWLRLLKPAGHWCLPALPLDVAVADLERLKARVEDVSTRNTRYSLISDSTSSKLAEAQQQQQPVSATAFDRLIEAAEIQEGRKCMDLTQLLPKKGGDLGVISIWGKGGGDLGMAWNAYIDQEICKSFACRAWVKLRHPFNPEEFVRSLTAQFCANSFKEEGSVVGIQVLMKTQGDPLKDFERQVMENRYLVVLEDLSTMAEWDAVRRFFPDMKNGSCIIVSTQQLEVASLSVGHPCHVNQLSAEHFVYAFFRKGSQLDGDKREETGQVSTSASKVNAANKWMEKNPLVGRESEKNDLLAITNTAVFSKFQVLSVWGIAGVGKSYLLKQLLCDRILSQHRLSEVYGWVDVSRPFNLRDFSRSLLSSFRSESLQAKETAYHDKMGSKNPIVECHEVLKEKKCLVVIDGLQSTKEWDSIQADLVSGSHPRTLFIVITTEEKIARHCRGNKGELVFNVKGLEAEAAYRLFDKEASKKSPFSDGDVAMLKELVSKCGGLPKVIVEIAGSVATKTLGRVDHARSICNKFMQELETNGEFGSLRGLFDWMDSYFRNCPDSLKPCIFYLSIFPRDHLIRRRRLVRRWIAEGYSRDNHEESAEVNGEKQFSDLLDLSIIHQPSALGLGDTRMVRCQVNGFFREYIISRRMEENLVFELGGSCALTTQRTGRHLVISEKWDRDRIVFDSIDFSRLRSLTVFGKWESFFISESMKLVRVLDLEDASGVKYSDLKKMVKLMCRLKFLSLRGCHEICRLPSSIGDLRQLQSLDVRHTSIVTLPVNITKLQKLQYIRAGTTAPSEKPSVLAPHLLSVSRGRHLVGVEVPPGIQKLTALHTLGVVNVSASGTKAVLEELKKLTQLRKLGVSGINKISSDKFFSAISVLVHLESLSLRLDKDSQGCLDGITLHLGSLRSLKLYGLGDKLPEWSNQLNKLAKLDLEMDILTKDVVEFLGNLKELCILRLRVKNLQHGKLHFCVIKSGLEDDSYMKVQILEIACSGSGSGSSSSLEVTFGKKTMKQLELLKVVDFCSGSPYQFSGLTNLSELKEVLLKGSNAQTLKGDLESQLENHPKKRKPVVKLEEPPCSS